MNTSTDSEKNESRKSDHLPHGERIILRFRADQQSPVNYSSKTSLDQPAQQAITIVFPMSTSSQQADLQTASAKPISPPQKKPNRAQRTQPKEALAVVEQAVTTNTAKRSTTKNMRHPSSNVVTKTSTQLPLSHNIRQSMTVSSSPTHSNSILRNETVPRDGARIEEVRRNHTFDSQAWPGLDAADFDAASILFAMSRSDETRPTTPNMIVASSPSLQNVPRSHASMSPSLNPLMEMLKPSIPETAAPIVTALQAPEVSTTYSRGRKRSVAAAFDSPSVHKEMPRQSNTKVVELFDKKSKG